jgi:hypothetical protein
MSTAQIPAASAGKHNEDKKGTTSELRPRPGRRLDRESVLSSTLLQLFLHTYLVCMHFFPFCVKGTQYASAGILGNKKIRMLQYSKKNDGKQEVYPCGHVPVSASPAAPPRGRPPGRNSFIPLCLNARTGHAHAPSPTTTAPPASFFLSLRTPHPLACFSSPSSLALLCLTAQHPRLYKRAPPCCSPTQTRTHGLSPPALFQSSSLSLSSPFTSHAASSNQKPTRCRVSPRPAPSPYTGATRR